MFTRRRVGHHAQNIKQLPWGKWKNGFVSRESRHTISHKAAVASLSQRWSVIRPHAVRRRKGRMCIVSPFDGVEAARPDLRYPPFSLTKLRRGRAFATCSLPQYGQIPAAGALLVTSRRPSGTASSGLAPLPIFPCCCMWIFFSCLLKSYLGRRTFHLAISSSNHF